MTISYIQREMGAPPMPPEAVGDEDRKALAAATRALPLQRLVGNGMDYADAVALHRMADAGIPWITATTFLGEANLTRARRAESAGSGRSARDHYRHAAACFRFGQSTLYFDDAEKKALYSRALDAFAEGARLDDPVTEKIGLQVGGATVGGWLMRPAGTTAGPVVMIFGGADGWREEYHSGARYLVERGIGAFLVDGLGQGETRILGNHHLAAPPEETFAGVADALVSRSFATSVGIWGNSLGGNFAARTASIHGGIAACCVNGGAAEPIEVLDRFPKFIDRICAMMGQRDHEPARALMTALAIDRGCRAIRCPLLVIHGGQDPIFGVPNALSIYEKASSPDKTAVVWDDGDHCIYNHSHEKHSLIADWFVKRMSA
ncbi:alpha/beta hydrolase [Azospirillum sp. YIM B02556]|uniref:Alpha/beta hydrolase n=1 Tax=Azospirillum endophyticum TaxID=2800326 RepID=A0ABS1F5Y9_9PROT|nr:YqiA/YcfP family alpha/beta fold hydrolase [Azospirillum endophyticum]MBK1838829.1 alpha/beta hydrolase [Azospirillum endophyticum]